MPAVGDLLAGRYRVLGSLGAGGMATVYRAHDERLEREVAIKVLLPNFAGDPVLATRFEREARTLAAGADPGVVSVYDVDPGDPPAGREPFFVMELCPGGSLADRLADGERLSPDDLIPILVSVADGLASLHARGVVHRDVKPSNILLAPDRAKLADFGLARSGAAAESSDLTTPGTVAGTMAYLAPEVLAGEASSPPADVYALGVAAFTGLTGTLPRPATSLRDLIATAGEPAPSVSARAPDLGTAFDNAVAAALDPEPAGRPDALAFASSLTGALGRWRRARPPIVTTGPPPSQPVADGDATTVMAVPVVSSQATAPTSRPGNRRVPRWPSLAVASVVVALAAIGLLALAGSVVQTGLPEGPTEPATSIAANPSPTQVPTPAASTAATPSVVDRALAAVDEVDSAIAGTIGSGGLKGKERNELERLAGDVRSALEAGELGTARAAAESLVKKIEGLDDELDEARARRLADAGATLVEILRGD